MFADDGPMYAYVDLVKLNAHFHATLNMIKWT